MHVTFLILNFNINKTVILIKLSAYDITLIMACVCLKEGPKLSQQSCIPDRRHAKRNNTKKQWERQEDEGKCVNKMQRKLLRPLQFCVKWVEFESDYSECSLGQQTWCCSSSRDFLWKQEIEKSRNVRELKCGLTAFFLEPRQSKQCWLRQSWNKWRDNISS